MIIEIVEMFIRMKAKYQRYCGKNLKDRDKDCDENCNNDISPQDAKNLDTKSASVVLQQDVVPTIPGTLGYA